jgi:pimeloyl-ACP methyl ester carboxylesterase
MNYIEIENLKINYERKGAGDTKIIFLHGNSCSLRYFDNQFEDEKLLNSFELIRLDLPGHGLSDKAIDLDTYSLPKLANIFSEFYKKLKIKNAIIVGSSVSGNIVLEAIENLQGIKGIMLIGSAPTGLTELEMFLPHPSLSLFFKGGLSDDDIKAIYDVVFYDSKYFTLLNNEVGKTDPDFRELFFPNSEKLIPKNQIEIIKNTKIPIAIINGKNEEILNLDYLKAVPFNNLWKNKKIFIPDTKHFPFVEKPKIFNDYLFNFCSQQF